MVNPRKSLFYPCSGKDLAAPLKQFKDPVDCFWFVDYHYTAAFRMPPIQGFSTPKTTSIRHLSGITLKKKQEYTVEVKTYTSVRDTDGRQVEINLCRGRGYDAFRSIFDQLGETLEVFFYRETA